MKRALPAIALSAAGLTWLLHAQGVIDTKAAGPAAASPPTTVPDAAAPPPSPDATDPSPTPSQTAPPTTRPSSTSRPVEGPVVDTRYGPVRVEVVVAGGRITDVRALEYPNEARRSQSISEQALPMLREEVLSAQSASIDTISGATYTSDAYGQSLQAALDSAGLVSQ
jgi:hypothetical protein